MNEIISKERFVKNMGVACLLYIDDEQHPMLLKITKYFKSCFPNKIEELEHFMFFSDFGRLEDISFNDFYDQLINKTL